VEEDIMTATPPIDLQNRGRVRRLPGVLAGLLTLLAAAAGIVLVPNLVAAWLGRMAARTRPAVAPRSE
jgi:hypothetical protein